MAGVWLRRGLWGTWFPPPAAAPCVLGGPRIEEAGVRGAPGQGHSQGSRSRPCPHPSLHPPAASSPVAALNGSQGPDTRLSCPPGHSPGSSGRGRPAGGAQRQVEAPGVCPRAPGPSVGPCLSVCPLLPPYPAAAHQAPPALGRGWGRCGGRAPPPLAVGPCCPGGRVSDLQTPGHGGQLVGHSVAWRAGGPRWENAACLPGSRGKNLARQVCLL